MKFSSNIKSVAATKFIIRSITVISARSTCKADITRFITLISEFLSNHPHTHISLIKFKNHYQPIMKQFAVTSVILIVLHTVLSEANVQIKPMPIDSKNSGKNDLKPEEARYQNPIMPEYYQGNRQGFVTSNIMENLGAYDRYGYNNLDNKFGTTYYDRYGTNKYGLDYNNRERFGSSEFCEKYF